MPTLLDTTEFALAKATLEETLQRIEKARQDRLSFLEDALIRAEAYLARVKQQALELPALIANYRAEIARLEATTGADILREAMSALKAECWGPPGEVVEVQSPKPAMLDLRTLPVGTVCEATDVLTCDGKPAGVDAGERFTIRRIDGYLFAETDTGGHYIEPVQPAHVVEPVKHACPRCMGEQRDWPIRLLTDCPAQGATGYFPAGMRFLARIDCYMTARSGAMTAVASQYGFEDVPPRSEWCDGRGKGGAE